MTVPEGLVAKWRRDWPIALGHWSRYTRLHDPQLCANPGDAAKEGLSGSFAMIRLADKSVVIDLPKIIEYGLEDYGVEILAHEIGHHVLAPATPADHFRVIARIRKGLPTLEVHAPMIANLYTDLLINDRLARQEGLRMADIYRKFAADAARDHKKTTTLWALYVGIYEELWSHERGSLGGPTVDAQLLGDAWLGARIVRVYARDWLMGASRFAALVLPYLADDTQATAQAVIFADTAAAGEGSEPFGVSDMDAGENEPVIHPSQDSAITGVADSDEAEPAPTAESKQGRGQHREPFEYGEILQAAGVKLDPAKMAARYYREQALPHLVRFPVQKQKRSSELQIEGVEPWDMGDPLDEIDWMASLTKSPHTIPGLTTLRRIYGEEPGDLERPEPVDLDLYVDSSGSMPNPKQQMSYLTLAGAIIALSALRVGSQVQVTLWSGKSQVMTTPGFVRDEKAILEVLTGFFGGATAFPIHKLRDTFAKRGPNDRPVHILQISDDGISTMFDQDEKGNSGWDVSERSLRIARGGGTMALNLSPGAQLPWRARAEAQGWAIETVTRFDELVDFARRFARRNYDRTLAKAVR